MSGWRGLFSAAVQWLLLVPFLAVSLFVLTVIPDPTPAEAYLAGRWTTLQSDEWAGRPPMDLEMDAEGGFELCVYRKEPGAKPLLLRGNYETVQGALVMAVGGQRMVWSILERDGQLKHRTAAGDAVRLRRVPSGATAPQPANVQVASGSE